MEPVTVQTGLVLARLLGATANTDKGTDVLRIDCAGVLDGYDDSARWVRIAPHFVAVDPDKPVMKLVRTVIYQADTSNDDTRRSVDVDPPKERPVRAHESHVAFPGGGQTWPASSDITFAQSFPFCWL